MSCEFDLISGEWLNRPEVFDIKKDALRIVTSPKTDFWQRSFYGFINDNAPALLFPTDLNFTFSCKVDFDYKKLFDQAGIIIYLDSDNWFKASIEYENAYIARLGSVVTNLGYSDWATRDIEPVSSIWYRISRRGPDFLLECSFDGETYQQVRIFHLHTLGKTNMERAKEKRFTGNEETLLRLGLYACSPSESSFEAKFSNFNFENSIWEAHT